MESEVATKLINMLLHPYPRVSASPLVPQPLLMIVGSHGRGGVFIHAFRFVHIARRGLDASCEAIEAKSSSPEAEHCRRFMSFDESSAEVGGFGCRRLKISLSKGSMDRSLCSLWPRLVAIVDIGYGVDVA